MTIFKKLVEIRKRGASLLAWCLIKLVRAYQIFLSPLLGPNCRFAPSCSAYAIEAVQKHGPFKGGKLAVIRISRCHPWGQSGYDPVPPIENKVKNHSLSECECRKK